MFGVNNCVVTETRLLAQVQCQASLFNPGFIHQDDHSGSLAGSLVCNDQSVVYQSCRCVVGMSKSCSW